MKIKLRTISNLIIVILLIILFMKIFFLKSLSNIKITDDYLFLKLLSTSNKNIEENSNKEEIKFKIDYKNIDLKAIDLSKTIDENTLIHEKIAPGTKGSFFILLDSNNDLRYKIQFYSINEKPKNLKFQALNNETLIGGANTLEELSDKLTGNINKNQKINITIKWYWDFENNNEEADKQDTKDSENIKTYKFKILTYGEEII